MKNLSKRNKIILAIAAVVVVILAGLLILQPPPIDQLFGTTAQLTITPSNASVAQGATIKFNVNSTVNSAEGCAWYSSNTNVATLVAYDIGSGKFQGVGVGTATIKVKCSDGSAGTELTVVPPPTATPTPTPTHTPTLPAPPTLMRPL